MAKSQSVQEETARTDEITRKAADEIARSDTSQSSPKQAQGKAKTHVHSDILQGSLWRAVPKFAIPVALTGILEQMATLIDTVMVGNLSGAEGPTAMAAVGSNTPITSLILNLFIGIALGSNVVIAHAIGKGDQATVHKAVHSSICLTAVGFVVLIFGEVIAEPLLRLLNVPEETLPYALTFFRVYLLGMPSILLYNFEAAIFRSVGITKMPLYALAVSSVLNIGLVSIFIPVFGWGVGGAAAATAICYTVSAAFLFWRLLKIDSPIRLNPRDLAIDIPVLKRILGIGVPTGVQSAVFAIANVVIQSCINSLGTEVMAASSAVISIEYVVYNLLNSFGQACTTFVGQNDGAGNIERCKKTFWVCFAEAEAVNMTNIAIMFFFGHQIMALFNSDPVVIDYGYVRMMAIFPAYTFSMAYETMSGYMRGFGISLAPAVLTALGVCGPRFFWVLCVFPKSPTFQTVMQIYPISLGLTCFLIFCVLMYLRPAATAVRGTNRMRA